MSKGGGVSSKSVVNAKKGRLPVVMPKKPSSRSKQGPSSVVGESKALKEIRKYQRSFDLLIPKKPLMRLIKEILTNNHPLVTAVRKNAFDALHHASEDLLVSEFAITNQNALHAKRVTNMKADWQLRKRQRKHDGMTVYEQESTQHAFHLEKEVGEADGATGEEVEVEVEED